MADEITLDAPLRTEFGKGAARRLRRGQRIPAVLYGHGIEPVHIALPAHATQLALRQANRLLALEIPGSKPRLALPKQVQRDPVTDRVEHVDLILIRRGERVTVEVPLVVVGEVRGEAVIVTDQTSITIEAEATKIPAHIEIDVSELQIGDTVVAGDLALPEGAVFPGEPDDLLLSVQAPQAKDLGEALAEEGEAAEGEAEEAAAAE
ncbi:MAG: 50S ribosomal protein L25/general stress protein Ctc [Propionibacteriaceae bacterium]|jgi:large subunit ribosomal protein L25|nr:50S ribosomal protein L25/general stress protein Ctc [Propionibacteriaceae bacterium]